MSKMYIGRYDRVTRTAVNHKYNYIVFNQTRIRNYLFICSHSVLLKYFDDKNKFINIRYTAWL